ncbi:MAG: UDP-N-acetylmuramoyl-tripeptide--D-alanyl-D-alanine ligase, partial [Acidobacteriota bacterium]|nr:UDP-N-acetylmuramoyl-tripeptide--D-alanyl-D-alanine ligase [Acidobacteriota bacterium]
MGAAFDLPAGWIAEATGGRLVAGDAARTVSGLSIDTRTLQPGALYVAIRGERLDGHAFIADAVTRGAAGVLVSDGSTAGQAPGVFVIVVADTLVALQQLGREIRRRAASIVVAITGSAGKTTTKEVTAVLLAGRHEVFRNRGNLNNHIGLPLSLAELTSGPDVAVVELGMNHKGEISALMALAEPEIRVWTNVGDAHIGFFVSRDAIADAKAEILERARPSDRLIVNADDPLIASRASAFRGRVITFGLAEGATVRATRIEPRGIDGTDATIETPKGAVAVTVPLVGMGNLLNVLAAVAVAIELDVPLDEIAAGIASLKPAAKRGEVIRRSDGITLVDDSYNSSPAALTQSLAALAASEAGRRAAVLGEMLELGDHAVVLHEECGR